VASTPRFGPAVLLCLLLHSASLAQVLVGPAAGLHVNWMKLHDAESKRLYKSWPSVSYHVGGSVSFRVQKRFFLQTSLLYARKGKVVEGELEPDLRNDAVFHYLDLPILYTAEFSARTENNLFYKWYLGIGPTLSYWMGGKGVLEHSDLNENQINPPGYDLPYKVRFRKDSLDVQPEEMNVSDPNRIQLGFNVSAGIIVEPDNINKFMVTLRFESMHTYLSPGKGTFGLPNELAYEDDLRVNSKALFLSFYYFIDLKTDQRKKGKSTLDKRQRK
jgi:hypothetical protein